MNRCPTCNRPIRATRASAATPKGRKWLLEDTAKASLAIGALERAIAGDGAWGQLDPLLADACRDEAERLRAAIAAPDKLWNIYRRKYQGGYGIEMPVAA